jgi:hypothetical protein
MDRAGMMVRVWGLWRRNGETWSLRAERSSLGGVPSSRVPPHTLPGWIRAASIHPSTFPGLSHTFPIADGRRNGVRPGYLQQPDFLHFLLSQVINRSLLSVAKRNGSALASLLASRDPPGQSQAMLAMLQPSRSRSRPPLNGTPRGQPTKGFPGFAILAGVVRNNEPKPRSLKRRPSQDIDA